MKSETRFNVVLIASAVFGGVVLALASIGLKPFLAPLRQPSVFIGAMWVVIIGIALYMLGLVIVQYNRIGWIMLYTGISCVCAGGIGSALLH